MQQPTQDIIRELHRMIEKHQEFQAHTEEVGKEFCEEHDLFLHTMMKSQVFLSSSIALLAALVLNEVRGPGIHKEKKEHEHQWQTGLSVIFSPKGHGDAVPKEFCLECGETRRL